MSGSRCASWGRYPYHTQNSHFCSWREDISHEMSEIVYQHKSTLAFGKGRSYGDSCLSISDHVLNISTLDRFISVNWETGIIVAESGVTLQKILNISIPNGWFLPVTPGTKYVTLGGAIANDVHGKNHHVRGTFGCHVQKFGLVRTNEEELTCSMESNKEFFTATIGGLGLTGIVSWVELQLMPIRSSLIDTTNIRFNSLNEFFDLSNELDNSHEYSVAWIDCLAKGDEIGRGVFMTGNHLTDGGLEVSKSRKFTMPFTPPVSVINKLTLKLLNTTYYRLHKPGRHQSSQSYDKYFYPLDGILHWNRAYGPRGFQQYQCVIPDENAEYAVQALLATIAEAGGGSFLAVLKKCGNIRSPGLLSFPMPGVSLALDFPQRSKFNKKLFVRLDGIVRETAGRLYPAKDAHMVGGDFRQSYPEWQKVESLRDPNLCSRFWERVIS